MSGGVRLPRERVRVFWRARIAGASMADAAAAAGVSVSGAANWVAESGGVIPDLEEPCGRYLCLAERETIAERWAAGDKAAEIARVIGRDRSTIGRELERGRTLRCERPVPDPDGRPLRRGPKPGTNRGRDRPQHERLRYRASVAQAKAEAGGRSRPRPARRKLLRCPELCAQVQHRLADDWSPEQISARLVEEFPDRPEMRVSHETIYQALYVQGRGELRRELTRHLRTGRTIRRPRRVPGERRGKRVIPEEIMISARPAEVTDRAVPGHWEGDLITGRLNKTAVGTLVERTTRYVMLLHLPADHGAEAVRDAMLAAIPTLPTQLWRSLTWDQGREMSRHAEITIATDLDIYFCDPHSPWQRGTNENTNGLLRQYLPKGSDLSTHTAAELHTIAELLNNRPRKTLGWKTPTETLAQLLSTPPTTTGVASLG
jgi:transposase, IS30 family